MASGFLFSGGRVNSKKIDINQLFFYAGLAMLFIGLVIKFSLGTGLIVVGGIIAGASYLIAWKMAHLNVTNDKPAEKQDAA
jgi:surface polysaccharide O-acyltransferase-like enzyme